MEVVVEKRLPEAVQLAGEGTLEAVGIVDGVPVVRAWYDRDYCSPFGRVTVIHVLEVTEDRFRGRGYGRTLLTELITRLGKNGIAVVGCNEYSARLCQSLGFEQIDPMKFWHDMETMRAGTYWFRRPEPITLSIVQWLRLEQKILKAMENLSRYDSEIPAKGSIDQGDASLKYLLTFDTPYRLGMTLTKTEQRYLASRPYYIVCLDYGGGEVFDYDTREEQLAAWHAFTPVTTPESEVEAVEAELAKYTHGLSDLFALALSLEFGWKIEELREPGGGLVHAYCLRPDGTRVDAEGVLTNDRLGEYGREGEVAACRITLADHRRLVEAGKRGGPAFGELERLRRYIRLHTDRYCA